MSYTIQVSLEVTVSNAVLTETLAMMSLPPTPANKDKLMELLKDHLESNPEDYGYDMEFTPDYLYDLVHLHASNFDNNWSRYLNVKEYNVVVTRMTKTTFSIGHRVLSEEPTDTVVISATLYNGRGESVEQQYMEEYLPEEVQGDVMKITKHLLGSLVSELHETYYEESRTDR